MDALSNIYLFPHVLDTMKAKMKVLADLVSTENSLPGTLMDIFSLCPHVLRVENK